MKKGFTLIELLIVIGILAILTAVVVVVLNPAQLLAQARDSQRMSDLDNVKSAIGFYLSTAASPDVSYNISGATSTVSVSGATCPFAGAGCTTVTLRTVDGTGWVRIVLTDASGGSPLSVLPIDPTDSTTYFYAYKGEDTNNTFELDGRLESSKYRGRMATDGGDKNTCATYVEDTCLYEIGTDPGLDL